MSRTEITQTPRIATAVTDASFVRFGGLAGILLAVTSLVSVVEYFLLVPTAQRLPITDVASYLTSLAQQPTGTLLFSGLYALIAFWAVVGIPAVYFRICAVGGAWALFATLVGEIAAIGTLVSALYQLASLRFLASLSPQSADIARILFQAPSAVNPFGIMTFGLTAVWFLVVSLLMTRAGLPRLLALVGLVAFLDLTVGFVASVADLPLVANYAALIAGAVGGPLFWLWLGILLFLRTSSDEQPA
jgi:hypothetical protein